MRIHSDVLTVSQLHASLPDGCYLSLDQPTTVHGSRSHERAFNVYLRGGAARHTRRPNSGTSFNNFAAGEYAATYDDWGHWLAALFAIDPNAKMAYYANADDFHRQTDNAYRIKVSA